MHPHIKDSLTQILQYKKKESFFFYSMLVSFLLGIALRSLLPLSIYIPIFCMVLALALLCYSITSSKAVFCACLLALFGLGLLRFHSVDREFGLLQGYDDGDITCSGIILDEPAHKESAQRFTALLSECKDVDVLGEVRVRVQAESYPFLRYGDEIILKGALKKPENFIHDITGREFNYIKYLRKDGISYGMFFPEFKRVSWGHGSLIKRTLFFLKERYLRALEQVLPEPHSALAGGVSVGAEESLGEDLEEKLRKTGLIHIVVLSGYNVSIIAEYLMKILSKTPVIFRSSVGIVSIVLFALFTGAGATIIRASLMASLVVVARLLGRDYDVMRALVFSGALMVFENPFILLFDPSFQLSFLATWGLIQFSPLMEHILSWLPARFGIREFSVATLSTQISVLPLLLYMTGEMSFVSLPVNVIVLPFIPLLMAISFGIGIIGQVSTTLAVVIGSVGYIISSYTFTIVEVFSSIPLASIYIPFISGWVACIAYVGIGICAIFIRKSYKSH